MEKVILQQNKCTAMKRFLIIIFCFVVILTTNAEYYLKAGDDLSSSCPVVLYFERTYTGRHIEVAACLNDFFKSGSYSPERLKQIRQEPTVLTRRLDSKLSNDKYLVYAQYYYEQKLAPGQWILLTDYFTAISHDKQVVITWESPAGKGEVNNKRYFYKIDDDIINHIIESGSNQYDFLNY